jgi:hypothetical protein
MLALLAATVLSSAGKPTAQAGPSCASSHQFQGTAPSDIVQQAFEQHYKQPLNRVDCRDNGLCYQKWGNDCTQAKE